MQHFEFLEQIPLYAIGNLPTDEAARLAEHLKICPECRALLNDYEFVANELLAQAPAQTAPVALGVRLQNLAEADAKRLATPNKQPAQHARPNFWQKSFALPRWAFALALAAFLLIGGLAAALVIQNQQREVTAQRVLALLQARDMKFVELMSGNDPTINSGFLCVVSGNSTALLWLYGMEPLDSEHVYQVWLRDGDTRHDGGIFRADGEGRAVAVIQAPRPLSEYTDIGITIEPAAGSSAPTTPRVVGGKLD